MSTLVLLLSIALVLIHNSHATKPSMSSNSLVLSLTRSISTNEFPTARSRGRRTLEDLSAVPLTELPYAFTMSLALGTPPQVVHNIIFDTGSDLVWVPCGSETFIFNCIDCDMFEPADFSSIFNPKRSHSIKRESCSSDLCVDIHVSFAGYYDTCTIIGCSLGSIVNGTCSRPCPSFAYIYGGGALAGILATDILDTNDHHSRSKNTTTTTTYTSTPINITFGCAHSAYDLPPGNVGFGKGPLSLPSQLGFLSKGFSHCFLPYQLSYNTNVSTPLILGDEAISSNEPFQYTPMLSNPHPLYQYFYYVGLESITIGTNMTTIQAPTSLRGFDSWGDGGMMVDSGTTLTQLPEKLYWKLISALESLVTQYPRAKKVEQHSTNDLCYVVPIVKGNDSLGLADDLPSLTFNFLGGASLPLPHGNTFRPHQPVNGSVIKCFAFQALDDDEPDCDAIFGNFQQHNVKVVYDLKKKRFGFLPTDCLAYAQTYRLNT